MKVNLYSEDECRLWCTSFMDGDDVTFEQIEKVDAELGEIPEWFDWEERDVIRMFDPGCYLADLDKPWHMTSRGLWLLTEGLAPGQAFLVRITQPHWYKCGGYENPDEMDVEYFWDVVGRANWTARQSANAWNRFLKNAPLSQEATRIQRDKERQFHLNAKPKDMVVERTVFGGYYDDYIPDKQRFALASIRGEKKKGPWGFRYPRHYICTSEDVPIYEDEKAYTSLFAAAQKRGIKITLAELKKLPTGHR